MRSVGQTKVSCASFFLKPAELTQVCKGLEQCQGKLSPFPQLGDGHNLEILLEVPVSTVSHPLWE